MNTSFYFVLWPLVWLFIIITNIPFFNGFEFLFACIIVSFVGYIIRKLLKKHIEYQNILDLAFLFETAYMNDYARFKRVAFLKMLADVICAIYMLIMYVAIISLPITPLIDILIFGVFTFLSVLSSIWNIKFYIRTRKAGQVIIDDNLQEQYLTYANARVGHSYEEILPPQPKYSKVIAISNRLFAVLSIVIGLFIIILSSINLSSINRNLYATTLLQTGYVFYGILALFFGLKDLLNMNKIKKGSFLLLSFLPLAMFLWILFPILTSLINGKYALEAYVANDSSLIYDAEVNLVQKTILFDDIKYLETADLKELSIKQLSVKDDLFGENNKKLLEAMVRANAEFQILYEDVKGQNIVIKFTPSELEYIYNNPTKTEIDII